MKTSNMKNLSAFCLMAILLFLITGCAEKALLVETFPPDKIVHHTDLKTLGDVETLNNIILYIDKGETFPLKITMDTDFMEFKQDHVDIVAKQKLFFMVRIPEDLTEREIAELSGLHAEHLAEMSEAEQKQVMERFKIYLSKDASHWASVYDKNAIHEILEFKSGQLSLGFLANTTDGIEASLSVKTRK